MDKKIDWDYVESGSRKHTRKAVIRCVNCSKPIKEGNYCSELCMKESKN